VETTVDDWSAIRSYEMQKLQKCMICIILIVYRWNCEEATATKFVRHKTSRFRLEAARHPPLDFVERFVRDET